MRSKDILYSNGGNDECYTPAYAVEPIAKYVADYERNVWEKNGNTTKRNLIVWCPFDKEDSEFVKQLSKWAFIDVVFSHIDNGQDFFNYEPKEWDIIVSNPPFTNKRKYFERALSFNKPFALIMTNTWLNDSAPKQLFKDKDLQLLMFDKRMKFISPDGRDNDKITFSSSYYCWNFLPKQIIMEELKIKKD
jgi:hypothetical protein